MTKSNFSISDNYIYVDLNLDNDKKKTNSNPNVRRNYYENNPKDVDSKCDENPIHQTFLLSKKSERHRL
jgi:hypothetical protein